jgi:hypothetical protein
MFATDQTVRRSTKVSVVAVCLCMTAFSQTEIRYAAATEMPLQFVADSYEIYQTVLPSNSIEWSDVARTQWLLQDVTTAKPVSADCNASDMTDLPKAVEAPPDRRAEWAEVLQDFAARCHDRYKLDRAHFRSDIPIRLLDQAARERYWKGVSGVMPPKNDIMRAPATPDEFKGAAGLHSFSAVYFNHNHTLAASYFGMGCGSLCGNWAWVVLEKTPKGWERLPWVHVVTFS